MISYLEGKIIAHDERSVIIQAASIGWRVFLGLLTLEKLKDKKGLVKVFTYEHHREDAHDLYGFLTIKELRFGELLMGVSGIGPRHAQLIVDTLTPDTIAAAVSENASEVFERISGIGTKLAKKIIIELEPKIRKLGILSGRIDLTALAEEDDALAALVSLGYRHREAGEALKKVSETTKGVSRRVEEALKILGKPRT